MRRLFLISDLHLSPKHAPSARRLKALQSQLYTRHRAHARDALLLLGDYGAGVASMQMVAGAFGGFPGRKLIVFGNHDVWSSAADKRTPEVYDKLQSLFADAGFAPLARGPQRLDEIAFVGNMGWYDLSLRGRCRAPEHAYTDKLYHSAHGVHGWNDGRYVDWGASDQEVTEGFLARLDEHLDACADAARVIVGLHHLPRADLVPFAGLRRHAPWLIPEGWRFLQAFLGSARFGERIAQRGNIEAVFCGHVHAAKVRRVGGVRYQSLAAGRLVVYPLG